LQQISGYRTQGAGQTSTQSRPLQRLPALQVKPATSVHRRQLVSSDVISRLNGAKTFKVEEDCLFAPLAFSDWWAPTLTYQRVLI